MAQALQFGCWLKNVQANATLRRGLTPEIGDYDNNTLSHCRRNSSQAIGFIFVLAGAALLLYTAVAA